MRESYEQFDPKGREKCSCPRCDGWYHRLDVHLRKSHGVNIKAYRKQNPNVKLISAAVKNKLKKKKKTSKVNKTSSGEFTLGVASLNMRTKLSDLEKSYVPKHDEDWVIDEQQKEELEDVMVGIQDAENIYIGGPTGCGKTALIKELASYIDQPLLRVQLKRDFRTSEFVGRPELVVDENGTQITQFRDGVLPFCMLNGIWIVLDEYDQAHPDVHMSLQSVLEGGDLILTEDFGRIVPKNPNAEDVSKHFRIIATANTFGRGDDSGLYAGAKIQNEATLDRFSCMILKNYPSADTEQNILKNKTGLNESKISKMVAVAQKVRQAQIIENCGCTFSTRRLIAWAKKTDRYKGDVRRASRVAVLNRLDPEDSRFVDSIIQRHFGGEV